MDWGTILKRSFADLTDDELALYYQKLVSTNIDDIPSELHRNYMELVRFIIQHEQARVSER